MPKTESVCTTVLAKAFIQNHIKFEAIDITRESYNLLLRKRETAMMFEEMFRAEKNDDWLDMLIDQMEYANKPYEEYQKEMARYIYIVRK